MYLEFCLRQSFIEPYKKQHPEWGFNGLGWVIYKRTYARPLDNGDIEEWFQSIRRVVEGVFGFLKYQYKLRGVHWPEKKMQALAERMYHKMFYMKLLPSGRNLWAMGTQYVFERGAAALNNCSFVSTSNIANNFSRPFTFLMDNSMLGVGVGGDTLGAGTVRIVRPPSGTLVYHIPDSREGWVESVKLILDAFMGKNPIPTFDYGLVRKQGEPLKGFGGKASGPKPLRFLHEALVQLLMDLIGDTITSTAIVDIFNLVGRCVVAGGIRRSAEVMLGQYNDADYMNLKNEDLWPEEMQSHRWVSNNSIFADVGMDYLAHADRLAPEKGEPIGLFWLENARHYRRMDGKRNGWDGNIQGINPCGEIGLESLEFCNLIETFPAHHEKMDDWLDTLMLGHLYTKTVSLIPTHHEETNEVVARNRRLGVSVSGVVQSTARHGFYGTRLMFDNGYNYLRRLDNVMSDRLGIERSRKLTTAKPSGTVSLLAGATPGVHYGFDDNYLRNVRFSPAAILLPVLAKAGFPMTPAYEESNTIVVSFPIRVRSGKSIQNASITDQLEVAAFVQRWWADNAVSVTVSYDEHEREAVPHALAEFDDKLKSVSFLPKDHGFKQAPYESISSEKYDELMDNIKGLSFDELHHIDKVVHDRDDKFCDSEHCTI